MVAIDEVLCVAALLVGLNNFLTEYCGVFCKIPNKCEREQLFCWVFHALLLGLETTHLPMDAAAKGIGMIVSGFTMQE